MGQSILNWCKILPFLIILVFTWFSCNQSLDSSTAFKSDFENTKFQPRLGSEYETNSQQDWQISESRIECIVSKENSYARLLTHQLTETVGDMEMTVNLGFFNQTISSSNKNWAGFSIGSKDGFLGYNDITNLEKGIHIGICTNGALFIGVPSPNHKDDIIVDALKTGVDLKVLLTSNNDGYTIDFSVLDRDSGKTLGHISKSEIATEYLVGDLVLVSNFETLNNKLNNIKSAWFKDWQIKGSKVKSLDEHTFNFKDGH